MKVLKKFRGANIDLLRLKATMYDGFGVEVFNVHYTYAGKICTMANNATLFSVIISPLYEQGGKSWRLYINILFVSFKIYEWWTKPKKDKCLECEDLCETKEFYVNGTPYCSKYCQD